MPSTPGLPLFALTRRSAFFRFSRSHTASINELATAERSGSHFATTDSASPPMTDGCASSAEVKTSANGKPKTIKMAKLSAKAKSSVQKLLKASGKKRSTFPANQKVELATLVSEAPEGDKV